MTELVVHPVTDRQFQAFAAAPPHAILLIGPAGIGKRSLAERLAEQVLGIGPGQLATYPYILQLGQAGESAISIDAIRQLEHFLSLRVPGEKVHNRVVLVENSDLMTIEAQNALLKTLEEPPTGTIVILTAQQQRSLLPTIVSRTQAMQILRPEKQALQQHFKQQEVDEFMQIYMMSGGLPGLMTALFDEVDHPMTAAVTRARQLLSQTTFERLLQVDELAKDKLGTRNILTVLQQMSHVSLQTAAGPAARRWQAVLSACYEATQALDESGQPKLLLTKLMLSL